MNISMIASGFNVAPTLTAIGRQTDLWREKTFRQEYAGSAHSDTETIYLRWAPKDTREDIQGSITSNNLPAMSLLPEAKLLILKALRKIKSKILGRVIIVSLKAHGSVDEHIDEGKYADHFERFHVCLLADGAEFYVRSADGAVESAKIKPGELWWFNHKAPHWAKNQTDKPRIHMIIDAVAPQYRRERA